MKAANNLLKYFPELSQNQIEQLESLPNLYSFWNKQINVISRKDIENIEQRHVLHSLGIAKIIEFLPKARILDVGTGGGFPGIPLAIMFPETNFLLVDSIGKKIKVVKEIAQELGLKNIKAEHCRAEQVNNKFDFIVSRAVTAMPTFIRWVENKILPENKHRLPNGILYLKGGDISMEMQGVEQEYKCYELSNYFNEEFFKTKLVVWLNLNTD